MQIVPNITKKCIFCTTAARIFVQSMLHKGAGTKMHKCLVGFKVGLWKK